MTPFTILAIATGLAADSFAASLVRGCMLTRNVARYALMIALLFGVTQAMMPFIGWQIGAETRDYIAAWDHWIAFTILLLIGGKTALEGISGLSEPEVQKDRRALRLVALIFTAFATSIDALAVGFGYALVDESMWELIIATGIITFATSWIGVHLGCRVSNAAGAQAEIAGGLILIAVGSNILYQHLSA